MKDKIPGGLADKKKPSDFDPKALAAGVKIEMEHTSDKAIATEIAMDHLTEDIKYYVKLKEVEKYDRVDEEIDGKKELDYGKEELDKRWRSLKKAVLNSSEAIMEIKDQEAQEPEQPQEEPQDDDMDGGETPQDDNDAAEEDPQQDQQPEVQGDESEADPEAKSPGPEELEQMLRDEDYSDAEIAHILHGHIMPEATIDDVKMESEKDMSGHKMEHQKRMDDLDYDLAGHEHETNGLDRDHKQRMLDLEYEYAKKEKEMELEHKKKELDLKLSTQKAKASERSKSVKGTDKSRHQDASQISKKERAGK